MNLNPPPGVPTKGSRTSSYKEPEGKDEDEDTSGNESEQSTTAGVATSKPGTGKPAAEKSIATANAMKFSARHRVLKTTLSTPPSLSPDL